MYCIELEKETAGQTGGQADRQFCFVQLLSSNYS